MEVFLFHLNLKLTFILMLIGFFIIPIFIIKFKNKFFVFSYLIIYSISLIIGVFFNVTFDYRNIYVSFLYTGNWFNSTFSFAYLEPLSIIINILLLFPLGLIVPLLSKSSYKKILSLSFLTTLIIEFLQFSLPIQRYPELLDIVNNTFSGILGYQYYLIVSKLISRGEKSDKLSK